MKRKLLKMMACLSIVAMLQSPLQALATSGEGQLSEITKNEEGEEGEEGEKESKEIVITGTVNEPTINEETGVVTVVVIPGEVTDGIKSVEVATWEDKNPDNVTLHTAAAKSDGTYVVEFNAADYNYLEGSFSVEAYITNTTDAKELVGATTFKIEVPDKEDEEGEPTEKVPSEEETSENTPSQDETVVPNEEKDNSQSELQNAPINKSVDVITGTLGKPVVDLATGTAKIVVTPGEVTGGVKAVRIPIWSNTDGQDDIVWYVATKQQDGTYIVDFNVSNHDYNFGNYTIHTYIENTAGTMRIIGSTTFAFNPEQSKITVTGSDSANIRTVEVSNAVNQRGESVKAAVWSDANGQDDILWNTMTLSDGKHTVSIDVSKYKSIGTYRVHIYRFDSAGKATIIGGTSFTVDGKVEAGITVNNIHAGNGTAEFIVKPELVTSGVKAVFIPTWSNENGMDDIVWYRAELVSGGIYTADFNVSKHDYETGTYTSHAYIQDNFGQMRLVDSSTFVIDSSGHKSEATAVDTDGKETNFQITLSNPVNQKGQDVKVAVWSSVNGQDDIRWIKMEQGAIGYSTSISIKDYKALGTYHAHVYMVGENGKMIFQDDVNFSVNGIVTGSVKADEVNGSTGTFKVTVSLNLDACKAGVSNVHIPVWLKDDQSDIKWYTATKISENVYQTTVDVKNHGSGFGNYKIHAYSTMNNGIFRGVGATSTTVEPVNYIQFSNLGSGKYKISIEGISTANVSRVWFPTWSDANGQDDLVWYEATKNGNKYEATISAVNHNDGGQFTTHVSVMDTAGKQVSIKAYQYNIPASEVKTEAERKIEDGVDTALSQSGRDLYAAYNWTSRNISYYRMNTHPATPSGYTREQYYAVMGFEQRIGNCFVYASVFTQLARELGYEARYVEGAVATVSGGSTRHGWTEVKVGGSWYICDPNLQNSVSVSLYMQPINSPRVRYYWY